MHDPIFSEGLPGAALAHARNVAGTWPRRALMSVACMQVRRVPTSRHTERSDPGMGTGNENHVNQPSDRSQRMDP